MNHNRPSKFTGTIFLSRWVLFVFVALLLSPINQAYAQNNGWSYPQTIPSFDLGSIPPILVTDQTGRVHAFSYQYLENQDVQKDRVIVYNKWTLDSGWSPPIDILLSPIKEARVTDAFLDDTGYMNLVFWGGDGTNAAIYYSKAPLDELEFPRSWSKPFIIGDQAGDPEGAVFAKTAQGNLVVIFHGTQFGNGLYVVNSNDGGNSWSFPAPIFIADDKAPNIFYLQAMESRTGWLHIIWNVYDTSGQGRGIYYSRSPDGETWDQPQLFAEAQEGLGTQTPAMVEYDGQLFAFYILPPKIIMQRSLDDGSTWQDPAILFPRHVGVNGSLAPVVDADNILHLFFGQRISGNPDIHGMWHSVWENNRWVEPEALIKGPRVLDIVGNNGFDPYGARAVLVPGNILMVAWNTDPGNKMKPNGVWYSYELLNTPPKAGLPALTLGASGVPPQTTPNPGLVPASSTPVLTTEIPPAQHTEAGPETTDSGRLILYGIISLGVLVVVAARIRSSRRAKK